jgi:ureidoglycolate dehydrogenase (NAD+)
MVNVEYEELLGIARSILGRLLSNSGHAKLAADAICMASLRGTDSHGIRLLPHYCDAIKNGRIVADAEFVFEKTFASSGIFDANHGMAHAAVSLAMDNAIEMATHSGIGFVSIKNSNHCGAMAPYAMRACGSDMIGFAFTNATAKVKVFNADTPYFGINPICMAAPMEDEDPFCYDAAPTLMSNNKVKMYKEAGEMLPPDVAADTEGQMTLDPSLARMLLPLGGHQGGYKGFGMAMMVDILSSLLSGMPNGSRVSSMYPMDGGDLSDKRYLGQFVGAVRIGAFEDPDVFKKRLKATAEEIRSYKNTDFKDKPVMVAGDPEKRTAKERLVSGIPLSESLWNWLLEKTK